MAGASMVGSAANYTETQYVCRASSTSRDKNVMPMLVTTRDMLLDAQANHYAVGAFNVENLEFVMAVIRAAEERRSPVIMQTTPGTVKYASLDYFAAMVRAAADAANVPVALHLDHGDGFDRCIAAMHAGYTSVMIDGSHVPFEDNIALTASVTKVALPIGIPVEAELGKVGGKEDDGPAVEGESPYTDPDEPSALPVTVLPKGGILFHDVNSMSQFHLRAQAQYNKSFNEKHLINLLAGFELSKIERHAESFEGWGIVYENGNIPFLDNIKWSWQ